MSYKNILAGMGQSKSIGEQVFDTALQYMIKDIFDDSIDPQVQFNLSKQVNETNHQRYAKADALNALEKVSKANIDSHYDQIDYNKMSNETVGNNIFKYRKGGVADGKIDWMAMEDAANKKVASSDLVKNTNSFYKNMGQGIPFRNPNTGNVEFIQDETFTSLFNIAKTDWEDKQAHRKDDFRVYTAMTRDRDEISNLLGGDDRVGLPKYQSESNTLTTLLDRFDKNTLEMRSRESMKDDIPADLPIWQKNAEEKALTLRTIASLEEDPHDVAGLQLKKSIDKGGNLAMLFTPTGEDKEGNKTYSDKDMTIMNMMENIMPDGNVVTNINGQVNIKFADVTAAIDRYVKAGNFEEAKMLAEKLLPGQNSAAKRKALITGMSDQYKKNVVETLQPSIAKYNSSGNNFLADTRSIVGDATLSADPGEGLFAKLAFNAIEQDEAKWSSKPYNKHFRNGMYDLVGYVQPIGRLTKSNYNVDVFGNKVDAIDGFGRKLLSMVAFGQGGERSANQQVIAMPGADGGKIYYSAGGQNKGKDDELTTLDIFDKNQVPPEMIHRILSEKFDIDPTDRQNLLRTLKFGNHNKNHGDREYTAFDEGSSMAFSESRMMGSALDYYFDSHSLINSHTKLVEKDPSKHIKPEDADLSQGDDDTYDWLTLTQQSATTGNILPGAKNKNPFSMMVMGTSESAKRTWNKLGDGTSFQVVAGSDSVNQTTQEAETMLSFDEFKKGAIFGYNSIYNYQQADSTIKAMAEKYAPGEGETSPWLENFMAEIGKKNSSIKLSEIPLEDIARGVMVAEGSLASGKDAPTLKQLGITEDFLAENRVAYLADINSKKKKKDPKEIVTIGAGDDDNEVPPIDLTNKLLPTDLGSPMEQVEQAAEIIEIQKSIASLGNDTQADEILAQLDLIKSQYNESIDREVVSPDYSPSLLNPTAHGDMVTVKGTGAYTDLDGYVSNSAQSKSMKETVDFFAKKGEILDEIYDVSSDLAHQMPLSMRLFGNNRNHSKTIMEDIQKNGKQSRYYNPRVKNIVDRYNQHELGYDRIQEIWGVEGAGVAGRNFADINDPSFGTGTTAGSIGATQFNQMVEGRKEVGLHLSDDGKSARQGIDKDFYSRKELFERDIAALTEQLNDIDPLTGEGRIDPKSYRGQLASLNSYLAREKRTLSKMSGTKEAALELLDKLRTYQQADKTVGSPI